MKIFLDVFIWAFQPGFMRLLLTQSIRHIALNKFFIFTKLDPEKPNFIMKRAIILGLIASLSWSTVFVAGRYLCNILGVYPLLVAFFRFFLAGLICVFYIIIKGQARSLSLVLKRPARIGILALTGITIMGSSVFWALKYSSAIDVSIIMNSNPIFIIPLSILIGESLNLRKTTGVIVGLLGCALVINGNLTSFQLTQKEHLTGNSIALVAALSWAVYTVLGKSLVREYGGLLVTSLNMLVGSVPILIILIGLGEFAIPSLNAFLAILYLAIFPTSIGFVFWYKALEELDASRLGPMQYLVPMGTALIAFLFLNEKLKFVSIAGMFLIFLGIYLTTISRNTLKSSQNSL
ncbi:EamA family transporter [Candidatus Poribacteria bacterium]|nr:EamA family transporter [Candidatus Poribacteria bacterium]